MSPQERAFVAKQRAIVAQRSSSRDRAQMPICSSSSWPLQTKVCLLPFVLAFDHMMIGAAVHLDARTPCKSTTVAWCGTGARSAKCPAILPLGSTEGRNLREPPPDLMLLALHE